MFAASDNCWPLPSPGLADSATLSQGERGLDPAGVTLITPTGDRPVPFALCEHWIGRQTYDGPLQWIVADDGREPTRVTRGQLHVRRERRADDPPHTLPCNLLAALPHVKYDKVMIIEDDDWYAPDYVERFAARLRYTHLAGESNAIYYRLDLSMWKTFPNRKWASMAATAMRGEAALANLAHSCRHAQTIDMAMWRRYRGRKYVFERRSERPLIVQMKGMPGRIGIGPHHSAPHGYRSDADYRRLYRWVGEELDLYEPFMRSRGHRAVA